MVGLGSKILTAVLQAGSSDWGRVGTIVKAAKGAPSFLQSFALSSQVEYLFPSTHYFAQCEDIVFTPLLTTFYHLRTQEADSHQMPYLEPQNRGGVHVLCKLPSWWYFVIAAKTD